MRPAYHYAPAANWLSDPNGLVYADGEWHLFYQHNPHGDQWGHMSWGHAVSDDLVRWTELPVALIEDERHLIFSGSAVVDTTGVAGFGDNAMIALYTGAGHDGGRQVQCLAASTDRGRAWVKFDGNPVIDRDSGDFRDPNVFWHAPTRRWIMIVALSAEDRALIYASDDLKRWEELSEIGALGLPGRIWECPLLIELPVAGSEETRWLFKVDLLSAGPGSGAVAICGTFDGRCFVPDRDADGAPDWFVVDHGRDFYAAVAWHAPRDGQGRPCWIGWIGNHAYQGALPPRGWRGSMSMPRRIGLVRRAGGYRLIQEVEPALRDRFEAPRPLSLAMEPRILPMACRLDLVIAPDPDLKLTLADSEGRTVTIVGDTKGFGFDRASAIHAAFDDPIRVDRLEGTVEMWIDAASIELATGGGETWVSVQHHLRGETLRVSIEGRGLTAIAAAELKRP